MILKHPFNREEHIFRSPQLADLLKDAIRFFNGTPVYELPSPHKFIGSGVYAIYYTGGNEFYTAISEVNRLAYNLPIYVGKAIPSGSRKGQDGKEATSLYNRLKEHAKSVKDSNNLKLADFQCRFIIIPHDENALIPPVESAIIKQYNPLWNVWVDGFGNHDPGKGRHGQARSQWDVIHPGRPWADKLKSIVGETDPNTVIKNIQEYVKLLKTGVLDDL